MAAEESFELESPHQSFRSTAAAKPEAEAASVLASGTPGFDVPEGGFPTEPATPPAPAIAERSEPPVAPPPPPQPEVASFDFDAGAPAVVVPPALAVPLPSAPPAPPELPPPAPAAATEAPPAAPPESPAPAEPALASLTLAELYFNQGFTDKAIDVYRQMLEREPDNERAQARLTELQALERRLKAEEQRSPALAAAPQDPRAVRRAAIERTIAQLESMLAAVRRD